MGERHSNDELTATTGETGQINDSFEEENYIKLLLNKCRNLQVDYYYNTYLRENINTKMI